MIKGLHHIRLVAADFAGGVSFAKDFGLMEADVRGGRAYLRGVGASAYSLVVEDGEQSAFAALAFEVDDPFDLENAVARHGASAPEQLHGPGGGVSVTLRDPDGNSIQLVHGIAPRERDVLRAPLLLNQGYDKVRVGPVQEKSPLGPPQLLRLGHVGLFITDWRASDAWYRDVLGLLPSDLSYVETTDNVVGGFYRLNRGAEHVDHHVVGMFQFPGKRGLHHLSFEVPNLEDQFVAHRWLTQRQRDSIWGVGRHPLGSHVFDVWRDPNGFRFETFSDTDLLDASSAPGIHDVKDMEMDLWSDRDVHIYFA